MEVFSLLINHSFIEEFDNRIPKNIEKIKTEKELIYDSFICN